jgi:transposase
MLSLVKLLEAPHAHRKQWVALFTTNLTLSVKKIITYYSVYSKLESGFNELKQEIGSQKIQARTEEAVTNHLNFCTMAVTITWLYGLSLKQTSIRRHAVCDRNHFAFSDVRYLIAQSVKQEIFYGDLNQLRKSEKNNFISRSLKLAA